jgi:type II secretory pathway pseudopilin PulG
MRVLTHWLVAVFIAVLVTLPTLVGKGHPRDPWIEAEALKGALMAALILVSLGSMAGGWKPADKPQGLMRVAMAGALLHVALFHLRFLLVPPTESIMYWISGVTWMMVSILLGYCAISRAKLEPIHMPHRGTTTGFTVLELLIVVAIIMLVASVMYPVILHSRSQSYRISSVSNLRQLHAAIILYREDYNGFPPHNTDPVLDGGYLRDVRILKHPLDPFASGYGTAVNHCSEEHPLHRFHQTYEVVPWGSGIWQELLTLDENPGIVADRSVGTRSRYPFSPPCHGIHEYFQGPMLRLRIDGSVQRARFVLGKVHDHEPDNISVRRLRLFTDSPIPWNLPKE